ncbi:MAG TPA: hypothetical protein VK661_07180 [Planctomycetota bacterium]|nr:hypothetical protein [Planctomycetota bacterium]
MRRFFSLNELTRRRDLMLAALVGSLGLDLLLGLVLVVKSLERRPVLVLPQEELAVPGEISDDAARDFARLYLVTFDTYTPSTLPAATEWLKKRLSPRTWTQASEGLERRLAVAREGRMSSLVVPLDEGAVNRNEGEVTVTARARRTIFIADRLSRESTAVYRIALEQVPHTAANPSGLVVASQAVEEEKDESGR